MTLFRLPIVAFATTLLVSIASPFAARANAQDILLDVKSPVAGAGAMNGIAIGDWDGDGTGDLAIGAPFDNTVALSAGAARIHSGKDGSVLTTFYGTYAMDDFGMTLARIPDVDGDGLDDLAIASPEADFAGVDTGSVFLYAGRTGALLFRIDGPNVNSIFGGTLGSAGDVDGDGIADLHVSQANSDAVVDLYSGADGHLIQQLHGVKGEQFGVSVSELDDFDGDGVHDLLVGSPRHKNAGGKVVGSASIISPVNGAVLRTHVGTYNLEEVGTGCGTLTDLDGDGVREYALAALYDDSGWGSKVVVYSGASGAVLGKIASATKKEWMGTQVDAAGDVNGDGIGDLVIGGGLWFDPTGKNFSACFLVSGKTLLPFDRADTADASLSYAAPFGDLNGDGFDDVLFGTVNLNYDGEVRVYSGDDLWLEGTPNEVVAGDLVELKTREGMPGTLSILVLEAIDGAPTFEVVGGVRSFGPTYGNALYGMTPSGLAGHVFTLRAYANGPAGPVIASASQTITCQ